MDMKHGKEPKVEIYWGFSELNWCYLPRPIKPDVLFTVTEEALILGLIN